MTDPATDLPFNPSAPEHYKWWRNARHKLEQGVQFTIPVDDPQCGYYKSRLNARAPYEAVAIWYKKDATMVAKKGMLPADPMKVWRFCAANPLSQEEYDEGVAEGFPSPMMGDNNPPEGDEAIQSEIDRALDEARTWLKSLPDLLISTQEQADHADRLVKDLRSSHKAADVAFKAAKLPHTQAINHIKEKWSPCLESSDKAIKALLARVTTFLTTEKARIAKITKDEGIDASPPKASSGGGRSTHLRKVVEVEVLDSLLAAKYYCDNPKILEVVQRLASAEFKATGKQPPGIKCREVEKAV